MLFVATAFRALFRDENFATIHRAEELETIPAMISAILTEDTDLQAKRLAA